jgi:hypothetical protein
MLLAEELVDGHFVKMLARSTIAYVSKKEKTPHELLKVSKKILSSIISLIM